MIKKILPYVLAALMLLGAYGHIANPAFYGPMVPAFIPLDIANWASVIVEAAIGIGLIIPSTRNWAAWGFFLLMIIFLPIHIYDLVQKRPVVGSRQAAVIRLLVQFLLIYAGWYVQRTSKPKHDLKISH